MGIVYRARDPIINRRVALKTITTGLSENPALLERFYREAQSAGGLQHPNIVTVYDMGEASGIPYIAMEFIEGESLEDVVTKKEPMPLAVKLSYAMQACKALDYAHKRGIIHRDIKPANLMVTKDGNLKVVDFGIARVMEASKTQTGMLIGTFAYMSPEQYQGEHADERSDIWSFGVLLYELLAYKRPFAGQTPAAVMHAICHLEPTPVSEVAPDCTPALQTVMNKLLMKSPTDRYQTMEDLLIDLDPIFKDLQSATVHQWIAEAEKLAKENEYTHARELLKRALQVESSNHQARALLETVNTELKRIQVRPEVESHLEKGLSLLSEGKVQEAKLEAEASLQLDSRFEPAKDLLHRVMQELERWQIVAGWLESARQQLAEGSPEQADAHLAKVFELEPKNQQALALRQQVEKEKTDRARRVHFLERMQEARALWTQQDYAKCINVLLALQKEFPGEEEVQRLLDTAREDEAEQRKRAKIATARNLLAGGQFQECKAILAELQKQFPNDQSVVGLLNDCTSDELTQVRTSGLKQARSLLAAHRYDDSQALLTKLKTQFPNDEEIPRLLQTIQSERAGDQLRSEIGQARKLLAEHKYAECEKMLQAVEKTSPKNADVAELFTVLRQEQAEQRKVAALAEARQLVVKKQYDPSIALLTKLQSEFPKDDQISKLLQSVKAEYAEQQEQAQLAQARSLMASQKYSDALALLEQLYRLHPNDSAVQKLQNAAKAEQEKLTRRERFQKEWASLKQLANDKNYAEVTARGDKLLSEYPAETDLKRLVEFAHAQQAQFDRETRLHSVLENVKQLRAANRLEEIVKVATDALAEFPGHAELTGIRDQAEEQVRKQKNRRLIENRVKEIKLKINREKFSEAIELAKQTLLTFGPDTAINQLLNSAQVEMDAREKKKADQGNIETVQRLIDSGKFDEATATLTDAIASGTLASADPKVKAALDAIEKKSSPTAEPVGSDKSTTLSKEYALLHGPIVEPGPAVSMPESAAAKAAAPQPVISSQPVAEPKIAPVEKAPSQKAKPAPAQKPQEKTKVESKPAPVVEKKPSAPPTPPPAKRPPVAPVPAPSGGMPKPLLIGGGAVVLIAVVFAVIHFMSSSTPKTQQALPATTTETTAPQENPLEVAQKKQLEQADQQVAAGDMEGAVATLDKAAAMNGPLTAAIQKKESSLKAALNDSGLRKVRQDEAVLWQKATTSLDAGDFRDAESGMKKILALPEGAARKDEAQQYISQIIPQRKQEWTLLEDTKKAANANDVNSLQRGLKFADQTIALGGPKRSEAQQLKNIITGKLAGLDQQKKGQQIADLTNGVRASLRSGDFTGAHRKADQLRDLGGDVSALNAEIDQAEKGRAADQAFQDTVQRYRQANSTDRSALESSRRELQAVVDSSGSHAGEARGYVDDLNRKLAKLNIPTINTPPPPTPKQPGTGDRDAIGALLDRYAKAFEDRNADSLRAIWPSLNQKLYSGYKLSFDNASNIKMRIDSRKIDLGSDGTTATANASVTQEYTPKKQTTKSITSDYSFQFVKKDGNWVISAVR